MVSTSQRAKLGWRYGSKLANAFKALSLAKLLADRRVHALRQAVADIHDHTHAPEKSTMVVNGRTSTLATAGHQSHGVIATVMPWRRCHIPGLDAEDKLSGD
jgi:hypothetical protein